MKKLGVCFLFAFFIFSCGGNYEDTKTSESAKASESQKEKINLITNKTITIRNQYTNEIIGTYHGKFKIYRWDKYTEITVLDAPDIVEAGILKDVSYDKPSIEISNNVIISIMDDSILNSTKE